MSEQEQLAKGNTRILLVDDDPLIIRMYERHLVNDGFDVVIAENGEEMLTALHKTPPNLILLDIMMPRFNGVEALHALKEDEKTSKIPVIILSNLGDKPEDKRKAKELGAVDYLVKAETDLKKLSKRINEILANEA